MRTLERAIRGELRDLPFVHVFPEGECYLWNQQIETFRLGAFYLACRLRLPVLPVTTVLHRRRFLGRESFRFAGKTVRVPPQVRVVIGRPLYPDGRGGSVKEEAVELARKARSVMQSTIDRRGGSKEMCRGRMPRIALHQS